MCVCPYTPNPPRLFAPLTPPIGRSSVQMDRFRIFDVFGNIRELVIPVLRKIARFLDLRACAFS